ncbi:transporter substrate-binding domain-containing protein [Bosea vaviloviae]|nr:transporter substrate-binding domain-containing protein [Bosea vaviloviae]
MSLRQPSTTIRAWPAYLLAVAILFWLGCGGALAQTPSQPEPSVPQARLVIGTMRAPPFVLRGDDGVWSGLSIELWQQIATALKLEFEMREFDYDPDGLLNAVERNEIDIAVAALPVTPEGEARFDYSHPYFAAGLGIAVKVEPQRSVLGTLASIVTWQSLITVAGLLGLLVTVGALIWLFERRRNPEHFDPRPAYGIADGVWWAAVTMTTTGYGDKTPLTWRGRTIGLVWMFASIFCIALFSATLASSFVVGKLKTGITGPADLPRSRIAAVAGTVGEQWLGLQGMTARSYPFVIQASKALRRGEVEALVFERPILGYMIKEYGWKDLVVLPQTLAVRDYAFAFPHDSAVKEKINRTLLTITQRREWRETVQRYVGASDGGG